MSSSIDMGDMKVHTKVQGGSNTRQMMSMLSYVLRDPFARVVGLNVVCRFTLFLYAFFLASSMEFLALTAFSYRAFYDAVLALAALISVCLNAGVISFSSGDSHSSPKEGSAYRGAKAADIGGGARFLVLLNFSNCALSMFTSTFIIFELIEWVFSLHHGPPDYSDSIYLGQVGLLSLIISFISSALKVQDLVLNCQHQLFTMTLSGNAAPQSTKMSPLQKYLQDNLPSLLLIMAAWLLSIHWIPGDPLCAIVLSLSSIGCSYNLAEATGKSLICATPPHLSPALQTCVYEASTCEGVLEVYNYHFWTNSPGVFVGSLWVRVRSSADQGQVRARVSSIFAHLLSSLTIQIEKSEWEFASSSKNGNAGNVSIPVTDDWNSQAHGHSHSQAHGHSHSQAHGQPQAHGHSHSHGHGQQESHQHQHPQQQEDVMIELSVQ